MRWVPIPDWEGQYECGVTKNGAISVRNVRTGEHLRPVAGFHNRFSLGYSSRRQQWVFAGMLAKLFKCPNGAYNKIISYRASAEDQKQIEEWIAVHGITKCPTRPALGDIEPTAVAETVASAADSGLEIIEGHIMPCRAAE